MYNPSMRKFKSVFPNIVPTLLPLMKIVYHWVNKQHS